MWKKIKCCSPNSIHQFASKSDCQNTPKVINSSYETTALAPSYTPKTVPDIEKFHRVDFTCLCQFLFASPLSFQKLSLMIPYLTHSFPKEFRNKLEIVQLLWTQVRSLPQAWRRVALASFLPEIQHIFFQVFLDCVSNNLCGLHINDW